MTKFDIKRSTIKTADHDRHRNTRLATTAFRYARAGLAILVRLLVGLVVFLPEGIQKLAFPEILGAGRFANIPI